MTLWQLKWTIIDRPGTHNHVARWEGRCTYCGHRVAGAARPDLPSDYPENLVRQTRKQPWRIPNEIIGRYRAMNAVIVAEATQAERIERWEDAWDAMIDDEEKIQDTDTCELQDTDWDLFLDEQQNIKDTEETV